MSGAIHLMDKCVYKYIGMINEFPHENLEISFDECTMLRLR